MTTGETLACLMAAGLCVILFAGYPVGLTLGGLAVLTAALAHWLGAIDPVLLGALPQRLYGILTSEVLIAIPLFILMGVTLERTRIAEDLLEALARRFGRLPGGLGYAVLLVGVLLAAAKGVVGATVATMGLVTLPAMLRHGYDPRLAAGTVAATSTLAQIMPPATVLVLLGDQLANAHQAAELAKGRFAPDPLTVSDLFAGAIGPALLLVLAYLGFLVLVARLKPAACPPITNTGTSTEVRLGLALLAPLALIIAVLGSILAGLATATEASAIGAAGALLLAGHKQRGARWLLPLATLAFLALLALRSGVDLRPGIGAPGLVALAAALMGVILAGLLIALRRLQRGQLLSPILARTLAMTSMIFLILIGATAFSLVFRALGGDELVARALATLPGGTAGAVATVMLAMFLLGFVMDAFEIIFVVVPIVGPALLALPGVDPVWLGVMMALNLQTSYLHPPLGPTLFFLRGVAPPQITTGHIYVGVLPFVAIQLAMLVVLWFAPTLATALPSWLLRH